MGTALTAEQVPRWAGWRRRVSVVFDGDSAGQRARAKAIPLFVDAGRRRAHRARCPRASTPTTSCAADGGPTPSAGWSRRAADAGPVHPGRGRDDATIPGRVAALERSPRCWSRSGTRPTRELYAAQLAGVLRMQPAQVRRAMQEAAAARSGARQTADTAAGRSRGPCGRRAPRGTAAACPPKSWRSWSLLAPHTRAAAPAGSRARPAICWSTRGLRQLYRVAAEQAAESRRAGYASLAGRRGAGRSRDASRRR